MLWRLRAWRRLSKAKPRNKKVDSGNANTSIDRHCEEPLRRRFHGAACCGPWIAHMGILASMVDFSFSCCGFFDGAGAGFRRAESSWKPVFPAARGCQGAKLAGGDGVPGMGAGLEVKVLRGARW